jgi:sugar lactone lactonase YvrE
MLDTQTGQVLRKTTLTLAEPRGVASDGSNLWVSDQAERMMHRLDRLGAPTDIAVAAPGTSDGPAASQLSGLAWDGTHLWTGTIAGWSSRIEQCDPATGEVVRGHFSIGYPVALETDGQHLWSATFSAAGDPGRIFQYDFATGAYLSHFDTPGLRPAGLAWDGTALWCVDSDSRTIFQLSLD